MKDFANQPERDLPEIAATATFTFACGPEQPCFNRCCQDLSLPLTPYDMARLRRNLQIDSNGLLSTFTRMEACEESGLPAPYMRMIEGPEAFCPFLSPAGCSIYEDRPGACRAYPLGRGARLVEGGIAERFFLLREERCLGHGQGIPQSPAQWLQSQGFAQYNYFNDRHMRFITMIRASGAPIGQRLRGMAMLALFQLDDFRRFIQKMRVFERLDISPERCEAIMDDSGVGDEACLDFAYDWLELLIFGQCGHLARKADQHG